MARRQQLRNRKVPLFASVSGENFTLSSRLSRGMTIRKGKRDTCEQNWNNPKLEQAVPNWDILFLGHFEVMSDSGTFQIYKSLSNWIVTKGLFCFRKVEKRPRSFFGSESLFSSAKVQNPPLTSNRVKFSKLIKIERKATSSRFATSAEKYEKLKWRKKSEKTEKGNPRTYSVAKRKMSRSIFRPTFQAIQGLFFTSHSTQFFQCFKLFLHCAWNRENARGQDFKTSLLIKKGPEPCQVPGTIKSAEGPLLAQFPLLFCSSLEGRESRVPLNPKANGLNRGLPISRRPTRTRLWRPSVSPAKNRGGWRLGNCVERAKDSICGQSPIKDGEEVYKDRMYPWVKCRPLHCKK